MIRIIIADDHTIFREGLRQILTAEDDLELVGEVMNGDDLLAQLATTPCDIALLDLSMPGLSGIALVRAVAGLAGAHRVIVLSMHDEHEYVVEALKAGAAGYVTKQSASDQLIDAIRRVSQGEMFISAKGTQANSAVHEARRTGTDLPHTRLSPREREVFDLLVAGRKASQIAHDLGLSIKTVSTHKANLLAKMDAETTVDLVRYALRHGLG